MTTHTPRRDPRHNIFGRDDALRGCAGVIPCATLPAEVLEPLPVKASELLKPANREDAALLEQIDPKRLPKHLAIIMDGNGRWAQHRHLPRIAGHRTGVKTARVIIETCSRLHLQCLTLYAFSLENWRRPQAEVQFLMRLLREYLKRELPTIQKNNIRLLFIGRSENLPDAVRADMKEEHGRYRARTPACGWCWPSIMAAAPNSSTRSMR